MKTIMHKLRGWMGSTLIFMGIAVAVIGGCLVKAGSWITSTEVSDLSDKELKQLYKEVTEARSKAEKETKDD